MAGESLRNLVGWRQRLMPPRYRAIAPGVLVTSESAWAVFELRHTDVGTRGERALDAHHDEAVSAFRILTGRRAHIRIVWGHVTGASYLAGLGIEEGAQEEPDGARVVEWARARAESIDALDLPERRIHLLVHLADRAPRGREFGVALGLLDTQVSRSDMAEYMAQSLQLGRQLARTLWRARQASSESIGWSIAREMHREASVPPDDSIEGAVLARLSAGKVDPMPDHLRIRDGRGDVAQFVAVLALTDFPEVMETPGSEWIEILNGLHTAPLLLPGWDRPWPIEVLADVSWRFEVLPGREARAKITRVKNLAKEQRRSAARGSAGEPPDVVVLAEDETAELEAELTRRNTALAIDHPRIVVRAASLEELDAKVAAVIGAYDGIGITAYLCEDEQGDVWVEQLPGDKVRVPDLGHHRDTAAMAQSWFWAGSQVGTTSPTVPCVGWVTGDAPTLHRFLATEATAAADAPVTAFTGRTRRGKTVSMMVTCLDACLAPVHQDLPPVVYFPDVKGDATGLVSAARRFGVPARVIAVEETAGGVLDAFVTASPALAQDSVAAQLSLLLPFALARESEDLIQWAVAEEARSHAADPRSWRVIELLQERGKTDQRAEQIARTLAAVARAGHGRLVAGRPTPGSEALTRATGVTVLDLRLPQLPEPGRPLAEWTPPMRTQVAALRGILGWCSSLAADMAERRRPKIIAIPEAHVLLATPEGRSWLDQTARMAAAQGVSLLIDSQDVEGLAAVPGIVEGLATIYGFAQRTSGQQQALAALVGLDDDFDAGALIGSLDRGVSDSDGKSTIRRGHCLAQDRWGDIATVQWLPPSDEVLALLDTSIGASADRAEEAQRALEDALQSKDSLESQEMS